MTSRVWVLFGHHHCIDRNRNDLEKCMQLEAEKAEVEKRAVNLSHKIEDQARKLTAKETELATLRSENASNASRAKQAERASATAIADAESARAAARQATDTGKAQAASAQKKAHAEAADKVLCYAIEYTGS